MRISDWSSDVCSSDLPCKFNVRNRAFAIICLKKIKMLITQRAGKQNTRKTFSKGIILPGGCIVIAPAAFQLSLHLGQPCLQVQKGSIRLQIGVSFSECKNATQSLLQLILGSNPAIDIAIAHRGGPVSGFNHPLKSAAFMRGVALYRIDQVGDQIMPLLQHDIDITPGVLYQISVSNKTVKYKNQQKNDQQTSGNKDYQRHIPAFRIYVKLHFSSFFS